MLDRYQRNIRYLRLSVTELCNLRCQYCMGEDGICKKNHEDMLREEEMADAVSAAASLGIDKVRITGGEPLLKQNILSICERIAAIDGISELSLTTNATLLAPIAEELRKAGVRRLNISLDTLREEKYRKLTRTGNLNDAMAGLEAALSAGFDRIKINTVLICGCNDDEIEDIAELTRRYPVDVRFIEMMPMLENSPFERDAYISAETVLHRIPTLIDTGEYDGVSGKYTLPGAQGYVGIISPISHKFCSSCNRLRLTADGYIKPCLHAGKEYCIKGLGRDEMKAMFQTAIANKPVEHHLQAAFVSEAGRNMNQIGG